jgi:hypothetical protein
LPSVNRTRLNLSLVDVFNAHIRDNVVIELRNQSLESLNQRFETGVAGAPVTLKDVPAFPTGLAEMTIKPELYIGKSIFVNVQAGGPFPVTETLFVHPDRAKPVFPSITNLPGYLADFLKRSKWKAVDWNALEPQRKGGLMNVCAKANQYELDPGKFMVEFFERLIDPLPARSFVVVDPGLHQRLLGRPHIFTQVSGALHKFPPGWETLPAQESFKTKDKSGNLQLTFARDTSGEGKMLVDVDLDDHSGVKHAFDVLKHWITGEDTHPYNIHQILKHFQNIDAGYRLL